MEKSIGNRVSKSSNEYSTTRRLSSFSNTRLLEKLLAFRVWVVRATLHKLFQTKLIEIGFFETIYLRNISKLFINNASCIIGTPKIFVVSKFPGKPPKRSKWNLTYKFFNLFPRLYQILELIPKLELEILAKFQMAPKKTFRHFFNLSS
jgi:hypothetical protein